MYTYIYIYIYTHAYMNNMLHCSIVCWFDQSCHDYGIWCCPVILTLVHASTY